MQLWSVAHFHPHFWVGATANPPKSEYGNGQLTRVAFRINDFLWNPYFRYLFDLPVRRLKVWILLILAIFCLKNWALVHSAEFWPIPLYLMYIMYYEESARNKCNSGPRNRPLQNPHFQPFKRYVVLNSFESFDGNSRNEGSMYEFNQIIFYNTAQYCDKSFQFHTVIWRIFFSNLLNCGMKTKSTTIVFKRRAHKWYLHNWNWHNWAWESES